MNPSLTFATAGRVLTQLRRDHRTLGMIIVILSAHHADQVRRR